ncbi:MAG: hypothetical protein LRY40_01500 [Shewanella fodinae]|nr:hypothetical protein [Shewanella fodinae]
MLAGESILSLALMDKQRLLIGTYTAGVFIYENGKTHLLADRNSGLVSNEVRALLQDPDGSVWIGTAQGLAHWHDGKIDNLTTQDGLPGNFVVELLRCDDKCGLVPALALLSINMASSLKCLSINLIRQNMLLAFIRSQRSDCFGLPLTVAYYVCGWTPVKST